MDLKEPAERDRAEEREESRLSFKSKREGIRIGLERMYEDLFLTARTVAVN